MTLLLHNATVIITHGINTLFAGVQGMLQWLGLPFQYATL